MNVALRPQHFLSLFAGCGGLDLALKLALPDARCVCYVEREIEAAEILAARFADASLDDAPVWSDICTFDARPWRGLVDGIVGGFPCQDLSYAGKRAGIQRGTRSGLFYEYVRVIRESDPNWVYIENVPAALAFPAGGIILSELAALGFDAEWGTLRARDVEASHGRKRAWILAYRRGAGRQQILRSSLGNESSHARRCTINGDQPEGICGTLVANGQRRGETWRLRYRTDEVSSGRSTDVALTGCDDLRRCSGCGEEACRRTCATAAGSGVKLGNATQFGRREGWPQSARQQGGPNVAVASGELGDTDDARLEGRRLLAGERGDEWVAKQAGSSLAGACREPSLFAPGPAAFQWLDVLVRNFWLRPALSPAEVESGLCGLANGMASPLDRRIDRLRAGGNGVVALQGAAALTELLRRAGIG